MGADSVHKAIGNNMQKESCIENFADFISLCQSASCKFQDELQTNDFYDFESKIKSRQTKNLVLPKIKDICEVSL